MVDNTISAGDLSSVYYEESLPMKNDSPEEPDNTTTRHAGTGSSITWTSFTLVKDDNDSKGEPEPGLQLNYPMDPMHVVQGLSDSDLIAEAERMKDFITGNDIDPNDGMENDEQELSSLHVPLVSADDGGAMILEVIKAEGPDWEDDDEQGTSSTFSSRSLSSLNIKRRATKRPIVSADAASASGPRKRGRRPLPGNEFKCDQCPASYRQKRNLLKHLLDAHQAREQVVNMYCLVPNCGFGCVHVDQLRRHLKYEHNVPISVEHLRFSNTKDFETWRYAYQREHNSNYVSSTGRQKNRDGSEVLYFNCSRSGRYKCQSRPDAKITRSRVVPTQKLGGYCPSSMKVFVHRDGSVQVTLWPVHYFHEMDAVHIQNLRLQRQDRDMIAHRLREGKSSAEIVEEFTQCSNPENPTRLNFITRKDVVNVRLAYNLPPSPTVYNRGRPRKRWPEQSIINSQGQYVILEGQPEDVLLSDSETQPQGLHVEQEYQMAVTEHGESVVLQQLADGSLVQVAEQDLPDDVLQVLLRLQAVHEPPPAAHEEIEVTAEPLTLSSPEAMRVSKNAVDDVVIGSDGDRE